MIEIELSMMAHNQRVEALLQPLLDEFEAQTGIHVLIHLLSWESGRAELNRNALYHRGPDVSEIGSTWVSDLVAMNALRSFTPQEVFKIGRPEDFAPSGWDTCHLTGDKTTWAIPLTLESFFIHYRKDLLSKAGIDETTAFRSHAEMQRTAECLRSFGYDVPALPPIFDDHFGAVHTLASWVWSEGGDYISADSKQVLFDHPEAMRGIQAYFRFFRTVSPRGVKLLNENKVGNLFLSGVAPIGFGTRTFYASQLETMSDAVKQNWGATVLPGAHFAGGANLVVWKHSRHEDEAVELVRYLTSPQVIMKYILDFWMLPPQLSLLDRPEIQNDLVLRAMAESARTGRAYASVPLWGLIEDRFIGMLTQLNALLFNDLSLDVDETVQKVVEATARRLNLTLSR